MNKPLLVFAMKEESQDVFDAYDVLHSGIGKVNATYALTGYLQKKQAIHRYQHGHRRQP